MKDILSQSEIDELIQSLISPGEEPVSVKKDKIKPYDFSRPNKFTREQVRAIEDIFGNFAKLLSLKLSDFVRSSCFFEVTYIEEQTFFEYTNSVPKSSLIGIFGIKDSEHNASVELSYSVVQGMISLLLGGDGNNKQTIFSGFTEIEINLIKRVLKVFIQPMIDVWKSLVELAIKLERVENMGQHIQIAAPSDIIAIITLKAQIAENEGFINFCIPYLLIEPVLKIISSTQGYTRSSKEDGISHEEYIKTRIVNNIVEMVCSLGKAYLTLDEFDRIQAGDVIKLKKKTSENAELLLNNIPKFKVDIGQKNNHYAIKINEHIERTN
ncbi:MAG: flagellar motor switch protein FliM [Clostridia bacterium]|jgi:flagellar motor switch protein FliM